MIRSFIVLILVLLCSTQTLNAQGINITEDKAEKLIQKMEPSPVEVIQVKTMKKWKLLDLSPTMKAHMNYNVVRVKYKVNDTIKMVVVDMHLVPIRYDPEIAMD